MCPTICYNPTPVYWPIFSVQGCLISARDHHFPPPHTHTHTHPHTPSSTAYVSCSNVTGNKSPQRQLINFRFSTNQQCRLLWSVIIKQINAFNLSRTCYWKFQLLVFHPAYYIVCQSKPSIQGLGNENAAIQQFQQLPFVQTSVRL